MCHGQAAHGYRHQADYRNPVGFRIAWLYARKPRDACISRPIEGTRGILPRVASVGGRGAIHALAQVTEPAQTASQLETQMLRSARRTFTIRRDGNTALALTNGELLRDLGDERTHGNTPGDYALLGEKRNNS
jgi:hypothetical protein